MGHLDLWTGPPRVCRKRTRCATDHTKILNIRNLAMVNGTHATIFLPVGIISSDFQAARQPRNVTLFPSYAVNTQLLHDEQYQ